MCAETGVDAHTRSCAVLTAYAESDFDELAVGVDKLGEPLSFGVFQQVPRYWPTAMDGAESQCRAFLQKFRENARYMNGELVHDCWIVQRWTVPGSAWPDPGSQFAREASTPGSQTHNYARRVVTLSTLINERRIP